MGILAAEMMGETRQMDETIDCALDAKAATGECPVWSPAEQVLYWIDIGAPSLNRLDPATGANSCWILPDAVGAFALMQGGRALVALRTGLHVLDLGSGALERRAEPPYDPANARFNDGRCDRAGRFWIGSLRQSNEAVDAGLYRYDRRGLSREIGGLGQANGLAFSPDDRVLYHADTAARMIYGYDFDISSGGISRRRVFAWLDARHGKPDGAAVDCAGCYWSACHGAGRLVRYRPDGTLDRELMLPVSQPTMMAFGGRDLTTLYVTSERHGLDAAQLAREPLAGGILSIPVDCAGLPEPMFDESA
jgi:sugar lactone lactonase YvrE